MTMSLLALTARRPLLVAALAPTTLGLMVGPAVLASGGEDGPPETIDITGVVRDFREKTEPGGHPDFENRPDHGFGRYSGNVTAMIGYDRKPVFVGAGRKVTEQWRDGARRQICYLMYDPARGDIEGQWGLSDTAGINSAESFHSWFHDAPGLNMSAALTITLVRQEDGQYVFDDREDPMYVALGGFFPIDDRYLGNSRGSDHNFHFTYEIHMEFEYDAGGDQFFKFVGDDDVWVYVDDRLAVDLGGVHAAHDQYIDMDRMNLVDGEVYTIDFFFAERFRPQSNFRIETNIPVRVAELPPLTAVYD